FARKRWARLTWNAIPTRKHGCQNAFGNPAKMRFGNMLPNAFGNFRFRLLSGETAAPRMVQLLHHGWCRFWPNCTAGGDTVSSLFYVSLSLICIRDLPRGIRMHSSLTRTARTTAISILRNTGAEDRGCQP